MKKTASDNYIFIIAGGIGKNITASAVLESFRAVHPDAHVTIATAYPFVWNQNPDINEAIDLNTDFSIYKDRVRNKNTTIFAHDVYHTEDYIYKRAHLVDCWCNLIGIKSTTLQPKLFLTNEEKKAAKDTLYKQIGVDNKKPLFFIQTSGGAPQQAYPVSWARDLPMSTAQEVVDIMNEKGYETIHLRRDNQPALTNTKWVQGTPREIMAMIPCSEKRLFIDSFPQHAAAALKLPSVVTWVSNTPDVFGEAVHINVQTSVPKSFRHYPNSYLEKIDITGALEQCPYDTDKLFDTNDLIKKLGV